jgi:Nif-specific regulatory protein
MKERLIISTGDGHSSVCELAAHQPVTLGRHRSNTVVLQDKCASRKHAELFHSNSRWFIRDCNTLNGTRVNGKRINEPQPLASGEEISIGDTKLVFLQEPSDNRLSAKPPPNGHHSEQPDPPSVEMPPTMLQVDELSALCSFMASAAEDSTPRALIERALALLHSQTGASLTGFLSLDAEEPLPRLVLPEKASVDAHLSRRLTRRVQTKGRLVRLNEETEASDSSSLLSFCDGLCVPVGGSTAPLGALHVYKTGKLFSEREACFCEVLAGYLTNSLRVLRSRRTLEAENCRLRGHSPAGGDDLIGDSLLMYRLRQDIGRLAPRCCSVLITGESGVGKELVASALHRLSDRRDGPFVPVNCAAIAASMSEAELFGHREGAFTNATADRPGFFQQADDGTIFLDEIGDLSQECQAKLLRVLEGKGFRPVGAVADEYVDVRVVAATHRDLETMVQQGKFRQDLYFRFQIQLKVPPLRDHAGDIPALVKHFLPALEQEYRRPLQITEQALSRLQAYSWPGNVRQLRTALESAVAMSDNQTLDVDDFRLPDTTGAAPHSGGCPVPSLNLNQLEEWAIRQALQRTNGHQGQAADLLGIHRDTLANKLKKNRPGRGEN